MMWRCECCGATFDSPVSKTVKENLDGENGWWESIEMYCPECRDEQIMEVQTDDADV